MAQMTMSSGLAMMVPEMKMIAPMSMSDKTIADAMMSKAVFI